MRNREFGRPRSAPPHLAHYLSMISVQNAFHICVTEIMHSGRKMRHFEVECWKLPTVGHEDLVCVSRSDIIF